MSTAGLQPPAADVWGDVVKAFEKALEDVRANRAPPPPISTSSLADILAHVNAALPAVIATLRAHQGVITGAAELLEALSKAGVPHAADIEAALLAAPGMLEKAEKWLPMIAGFLAATRPAPTYQPGSDPIFRGR